MLIPTLNFSDISPLFCVSVRKRELTLSLWKNDSKGERFYMAVLVFLQPSVVPDLRNSSLITAGTPNGRSSQKNYSLKLKAIPQSTWTMDEVFQNLSEILNAFKEGESTELCSDSLGFLSFFKNPLKWFHLCEVLELLDSEGRRVEWWAPRTGRMECGGVFWVQSVSLGRWTRRRIMVIVAQQGECT